MVLLKFTVFVDYFLTNYEIIYLLMMFYSIWLLALQISIQNEWSKNIPQHQTTNGCTFKSVNRVLCLGCTW